MLLRFPTSDALRLALTAEVIPREHAQAQVAFALADDGAIWVDAAEDLPRAAAKELKKWGVESRRGPGELRDRFELATCWLQLVPLVKESAIASGDKTPILFELRRSEDLPELVAEILRLGNDRQSYRHVEAGEESRTLLRVIGPPYYSLLRALGDSAEKPAAFYEQAPRVWVQLGYKHPLALQIQPAAGQMLLLRGPRTWETLAEGAFHEIYQQLEFKLPSADVPWEDKELASRITVPLQLTTASSTDAAELWVLHEDAQKQVEDLVRHADDQLISRLAFAVGQIADRTVVVLRVRPSKLPPPVLVLRGVAYQPYLKLQNLFVPIGRRLYPPLRRDIVAKLLAADANRLVWLEPGEGSSFTPESLPDNGFRPLNQWVEYVLDHEQVALSAWAAAHTFEFEPFICHEDQPARPKEPLEKRAERQPPKPQSKPASVGKASSTAAQDEIVIAEVVEDGQREYFEPQKSTPQPGQLQKELRQVEAKFTELTDPLDAPPRRELWRQMGRLNAALEHRQDASLCWASALWEETAPQNAVLRDWLVSEHGERPQDLLAWPKLAAAARETAPQPAVASHLAAALSWHAAAENSPPHLTAAIGHAAQLLERNEAHLPVRVAWLGWVSLARLSGGDSLLLARARDRVLERLYQHGLTAEFDLPGFLRSRGTGDSDRFRVLRQRLLHLREMVAEWIIEPPGATTRTRTYSDLMFAYGLSRLGETAECERILGWTRRQLTGKDDLHAWVRDAFELRIKEARQGSSQVGLGEDLMRRLEGMERTTRYKADRLRQHSWILEPFERIDPYRRWHRRYSDDLARDLALLMDIPDRDELRGRISQLTRSFAATPAFTSQRLRVLTAALELGPRLGEAAAVELLDQVMPLLNVCDDVVSRAMLLEKALLVAAHFDQAEAVQAFVDKFEQSLEEIVGHYLRLQVEHQPENKEKLVAIESLFDQSLRGLRKLGMRDAISRIFGRIVALVRDMSARRPVKKLPLRGDEATRASMLLLCVAGGWFYFGQNEQAAEVTGQVRRQLFEEELPPIQRTNLACAYVSAVGQASIETALPLIEELFQSRSDNSGQKNLHGVKDQQTTASHFSLSQLDVVEATVLALVSDEASLSPESRRWLDEDEFLVRRRIHRDVRAMTG